MIRSFKCKATQALFEGKCPKKFRAIQAVAERKLVQLDAAQTIEFLRSPPGNMLEPLYSDRKGQWSIRINKQFRVCFRFENSNAYDVEIVDYH